SARLGAIRQNRVTNAGVLAAASANHHDVGNVDGCFLFHDAALDVLLGIRPGVALYDRDVFHDHAVGLGVDRQHPPALACVAPSDHADLVALANLDRLAFRSFV